MEILGVDIGGSGIKIALVETREGKLISERIRIKTPKPADASAVLDVVVNTVKDLNWKGPIGCGYPGVVQNQAVKTAANLGDNWMDYKLGEAIQRATGCPTWVLNDGDAAAIAEMEFGAGRGFDGLAMMVTIGTGLGTAFMRKGELWTNTELGHVYLANGMEAEHYASDAARKFENLTWEAWAKRFNEYLAYVHGLFWPEMFILGGGATTKPELFQDYLKAPCRIAIATQGNEAGIIGAAMAAERYLPEEVLEKASTTQTAAS